MDNSEYLCPPEASMCCHTAQRRGTMNGFGGKAYTERHFKVSLRWRGVSDRVGSSWIRLALLAWTFMGFIVQYLGPTARTHRGRSTRLQTRTRGDVLEDQPGPSSVLISDLCTTHTHRHRQRRTPKDPTDSRTFGLTDTLGLDGFEANSPPMLKPEPSALGAGVGLACVQHQPNPDGSTRGRHTARVKRWGKERE